MNENCNRPIMDEGRLYTTAILRAGRSIEEISSEELAEPQEEITRDGIAEEINKARNTASFLRTGGSVEKISSEELAEPQEEITPNLVSRRLVWPGRCCHCNKLIMAGEEFYSVSFGTSRIPDHYEVTAHGEYCDDCGPVNPR